jgi:hypothetical protein
VYSLSSSCIKATLGKDLSLFEKWLKLWPTFKSLAHYSLATVAKYVYRYAVLTFGAYFLQH